jgi:hypothetical protein
VNSTEWLWQLQEMPMREGASMGKITFRDRRGPP